MSMLTPCSDTTHTPRYRWLKVDQPGWVCPDCENPRETRVTVELGGAAVWHDGLEALVEHRSDGHPVPDGHVEAVEATHYACKWLWERRDIWPCFDPRQCDQVAVWGVHPLDWTPIKYYCDKHLPVPAERHG
jgi:hypothetical protein